MKVTGGQDDEAVGRPQIPNAAFEQALATFIRRSQIFSKVVDDQTEAEDFILVVTLFSIDKRLFGHTVRLEAGWTLQRADTKALAWRESIISEFNGSNVQLATEGAAKNNITQVSSKARNSIFDTRMILRSYSRFQIGRKD